jgi:hypothetical protein
MMDDLSFKIKIIINGIMKLIFKILLITLALGQNSLAEKSQNTSFEDWHFYIDDSKEKKICYVYSVPKKSDGNYRKRNKPYFMVKNIENGNSEITVSSGFVYQNNSEVQISLKNKKFNIFTFENLAWSYSMNQDLDITKEMKKNNSLEIYSINKYGKSSRDTYSLNGFNQAYSKIIQICNNHEPY